ncbi:MAG TPA: DUF2267 domain-containing protein [Desulfuromonadaceae bacterium]|nr:DUF2267 domain-containing protein [Desulfuromonadaceae bacterium]
MTYDDFMGEVQHRTGLSSLGDAVAAVHATLETLAERLTDDEAKALASQLPREVAVYILGSVLVEPDRMSLDEFLNRITWREQIGRTDAIEHARVVMEVLQEAASEQETNEVLSQLPPEYHAFIASDDQGEWKQAA